jgi:Na+/H+ antiporter NhaD/arsenite permease-like protein
MLVLNDAMIASAIVLTITFALIFTEQLHGMERSKVAAGGAVLMIIVGQIYGFYSTEEAIEAVDWSVIFLLAGMMTIVSIMIPTGGFDRLAYRMAALSKGRLYMMLVLIGTCVTVLSLLLDNVTTVVIFGPLIVLIAKAQRINPIPYLLAAALLSDTGGVGTLVGDPPNIMIGSAAGIGFNTFAIKMGPPVFVVWIVVLVMLKFLFARQLAEKPAQVEFKDVGLKNAKVWRASVTVLGIMVILFINERTLHWEPWFVAILGMSAIVWVSRDLLMDHAVEHIELTLLMFFIGLFMIVGGVEHSEFLIWVGQFIQPFVESDLLLATIVLMWVAAALSAAIDNIPFTAAMIPIILGIEQTGINVSPLWWGLAMGVGLGGNGTHIGSTANVFIVTISERLARERNDPSLAITPGLWFRKGTPAMIGTLIAATILMVVFWNWFSAPLAG